MTDLFLNLLWKGELAVKFWRLGLKVLFFWLRIFPIACSFVVLGSIRFTQRFFWLICSSKESESSNSIGPFFDLIYVSFGVCISSVSL